MLFQLTTIGFIIISVLLFHITPGRFRKWVLLAASVFFIYWQGKAFGLTVLLFITVISYLFGGLISYYQKRDEVKLAHISTAIGIAIPALILFGWKYLYIAASLVGVSVPEKAAELGLPIGLSFYTFQAISYVADVSMGKTTLQKNPFIYALYMMWFPKWMSGPIEREGAFLEEIKKTESVKLFDFDRTIRALSYLIWGLFMKMVIADRIGIPVDAAFENPSEYGFLTLMLVSLLYTMQIYCDFAGYTNIMIGISALYGIELTQNFRTPYLTENIVEFWRGWHISLSNFLKDYIYIPLGGNRRGGARKAFNTLVVFFVCGMWHGAGLTFIIWGIFHGVMNVLSSFLRKSKAAFLVKGMLGRIISFILVSFAWIFFRAPDMSVAASYIKGMIPFVGTAGIRTGLSFEDGPMLGLVQTEWWIAGLSLVILTVMDIISYRKDTIPPETMSARWGDITRGAVFVFLALVILIFGKYGAGEEIRSFVYAQF
ncbi:MBOAT family O-acyltransferase [Butyrivibrio sp. WCD2001]|uniref:MBOAT family O-acyltransferase n=1 Tax=Butyrivibrio sp. WCD2001 TaxID=1280681 RepID=UPI000479600A|nr:MBOAT family O-acyltransferase [Butyrivibrio sp. WCD2001]